MSLIASSSVALTSASYCAYFLNFTSSIASEETPILKDILIINSLMNITQFHRVV
jgi:hypothetical protein